MTEHKNIYAALAAAQASMGTVVKGATNPAFKSKYADLADVVAVVVPALSAQGIAMFHSMARDDHGLIMRTTLAHGATDTTVTCDVPLIVDRQNMQGMKSATTYAKRIGVESLTGIAPEDDDGNAAASAPPVKSATKPAAKADAPRDAVAIADSLIATFAKAGTPEALDATKADGTKVAAAWDWLLENAEAQAARVAKAFADRHIALAAPKPADLGGDAIPY